MWIARVVCCPLSTTANTHPHQQSKQTVGRFPSLDELEDIRDAALAKEGAASGDNNRGLLSELGRFIDSFRRM